jgi:hypothetical protein
MIYDPELERLLAAKDAAAQLYSEWNRLNELAAIREALECKETGEEAILTANAEDEAWVKLNDHRKKNR